MVVKVKEMLRQSNENALNLVKRQLVTRPIVEFCCPRRGVPRDGLSRFKRTAVVEVDGDACSAKRMASDAPTEAGTASSATAATQSCVLSVASAKSLAETPTTSLAVWM